MNEFESDKKWPAVEKACLEILEVIQARESGSTDLREGLVRTPARMTKALQFLTKGYDEDVNKYLSVVFNEEIHDIVIIDNINFHSLCEHHVLPFYGKFHIGYLPNKKGQVLGASKIPRAVDVFARRLQNQERLGTQIADAIMNSPAKPEGVIVFGEAVHMCMRMRGVESTESVMRTFAARGQFKTDSSLESRFYQMLKAGRI